MVWCLKPFSTVFKLYHDGQIFFPSHWLLSVITIVETNDNGERGMNSVTMTIIRILVEQGLEPTTSCSQVHNAID